MLFWCPRCPAAASPAGQLRGWRLPGSAGAPRAQRSPAQQRGGTGTLWTALREEHNRAGRLLR